MYLCVGLCSPLLYRDFMRKISAAGRTQLCDYKQQMMNYIRNDCGLRCRNVRNVMNSTNRYRHIEHED